MSQSPESKLLNREATHAQHDIADSIERLRETFVTATSVEAWVREYPMTSAIAAFLSGIGIGATLPSNEAESQTSSGADPQPTLPPPAHAEPEWKSLVQTALIAPLAMGITRSTENLIKEFFEGPKAKP